MHETVLVPVDGSEESFDAVRHAAELATTSGATLHALYVKETRPTFTAPGLSGLEEDLDEGERTYAEEQLAEAVELARTYDVDCVTEILNGPPHTKIVEYAEDIDADLIVMGATGRRGLDDVLLGSTTQRVARNTTIPVTIVR